MLQITGMSLFIVSMVICCGSSLISKEIATRTPLTQMGWGFGGEEIVYSAQQAVTISLIAAIFFGLGLAGAGLGLQAQHRRAATFATILAAAATLFWLVHAVFFAAAMRSVLMTLLAAGLCLLHGLLLLFAAVAMREMRLNPPPPGHEILPADYKIPYSHMHQDPPEVRLARELEQRRQKLAVQQKELEMLEEKLRRKMDE